MDASAVSASAVHASASLTSISAWLGALQLGAFAGAVGQLVRAVSGLAKYTRGRAAGTTDEQFHASTLVISLLIGATAGALAAVALLGTGGTTEVTPQTILGLMAAGYSGADFIEGFAGKHFQAQPDDAEDSSQKKVEEGRAEDKAAATTAMQKLAADSGVAVQQMSDATTSLTAAAKAAQEAAVALNATLSKAQGLQDAGIVVEALKGAGNQSKGGDGGHPEIVDANAGQNLGQTAPHELGVLDKVNFPA